MGGPAAPPNADNLALRFLASEGYLPLSLADHPGMVEAYQNLFAKSNQFFALPADSPQKTTYQAVSGPAASEEGYSKIPSEKSILTTRTSTRCPELLRDDLRKAWNLTGAFMEKTTSAIAQTLALKPDAFAPFVTPCATLTDTKTPTQLRMFRYDRPTGTNPTINAEKHKDLGLLSLVVGHSPGLEVQNVSNNSWIPIEEDACLPPGSRTRSGGLTATLLGGETLAFLSRRRYRAGLHRVVCAPASASNNDPFRFSIVYTLRPAVAPLYTKDFESEITGQFAVEERCEGVSSAKLFEAMLSSHWNINAAKEVREKQREKQRLKREQSSVEQDKGIRCERQS
ncbi:hypothetical protein N7G274_000208 [Stereocaulon virgatum]|uniref:Fe2OG dioxygenase domain-containing protein n=1 Tax=Stereocaulon virgatum TaxID=373712 RepID=A0ABR4ARG6_9LECA